MDHSIRPLTDDEVKRRQLSDDGLTDEERDRIDAAWDFSKYDLQEQQRREHAALQEQQRMLRMCRSAV